MNKIGLLNYLSNDEEYFIVEASDIACGHGLPIENHAIKEKSHQTINYIKCQRGNNDIDQISSLKYFFKVIKRVNKSEDEHSRKIIVHWLVKVSGLITKGAKKSDTLLAWFMFHNISEIYRYLKRKHKLQASLVTQNPKSPPNPVHAEDKT